MTAFTPLRRHWILVASAVAVLLAAAITVLSVIYRDDLFGVLNDPGTPFQIWEPPPAPDYASADAWSLAPQLAETDEAAVFFVHPTTYSGGGNWNAPIEKPLSRNQIDRVMIPNHAAPFSSAGPVFAPRYRQASLYSFLTNREDARRARLFAYEDVARAFDAFLARIGEDRAFVIAGVGQGGLHAAGLLRDRVAPDEDLRDRMIAAYVLDYPLPLDLFETQLDPLRPCRTATDFRCVVAFTATRADDVRRIAFLTEQLMMWGPGGMEALTGRRLFCMNPLLWNASEDYAPARLNRGAVAAEGLEPGVTPSPAPGQTGAQCQDGLLLIEEAESKRFRPPLALAERYRTPRYNLFYEDIRANAGARAQAALDRMANEALYAEPITRTVVIDDAPVNPVPD